MKSVKKNENVSLYGCLGELMAPVYAILEPTYSCPSNCPGCPGKESSGKVISGKVTSGKETELSLSEWEGIIDNLSGYVGQFRLSGGEPVNYQHFSKLIEFIEKKNIPYIILTAGLWNDPDKVISILKESRMLKGLSFSVHGHNNNVHDLFMSHPAFNTMIRNLEIAVKEGFPVQTSGVIGEFNKIYIKDILRFVFKIGSKAHVFHRYNGFINQRVTLYRDELNQILSFIRQVKEKGLPVYLDGCFPRCFNNNEFGCLAGITYCSIDPYGNVKPCPFSKTSFGSLKNSTIRKIWSKKGFRKWVEDVPVSCSECAALSVCHGGCHVLREQFLIRHDPLMNEPLKIHDTLKQEESYLFDDMNAKPVSRFHLRKEKFGFSLIKASEVMTLSSKESHILKLYNGEKTLNEIKQLSGEKGLKFTKELVLRGFIELISDDRIV